MKIILVLATVFATTIGISQDLYITKTGTIHFFSETSIEDIEAENTTATCILKVNEGKLAFKVLMKSFIFEKAAMQQHFNDDYVHSDEFPKATFDGQIANYEKIDFTKDGEHEVTVNGTMTMHGVKQPVEVTGTIIIADNTISLNSNFDVKLSDYDIQVPTNFLKRINNVINITVKADLEPYVR